MKEIYTGAVTRYCKPSSLKDGKPSAWSFRLRDSEDSLSVYLLNYFKALSEKESVVDVKNKKQQEGFNFKNNGTFCTLDIEESKAYVASMSEKISYKELLLPHCGVFHQYKYNQDMLISELLSQCVKNNYKMTDL